VAAGPLVSLAVNYIIPGNPALHPSGRLRRSKTFHEAAREK
jgi:hypothetical protein